MKIDLYNQSGEKLKQIEVSKEIFEQPFMEDLIHRALIRQMSNGRVAIAHVKTKGEVRGGGRKPFRQKGTGRARQGSLNNPQYRGSGKAFGPRNDRNFELKMPRKQRRLALFSAISEKVRNSQVFALDKYETTEAKTKAFIQMLKNLPIKNDTLIVLAEKNQSIERSSRNIPTVKTILVNYLNIADLQKYQNVIFMEPALKKIEEVFLK